MRAVPMKINPDLSMRLEKRGPGNETFSLVMSPIEWHEVYELAKFAQLALAYDCEAPYVEQVFTYDLTDGVPQPKEIDTDANTQSAFSAIHRMAKTIPPDGKNCGDVTLALPKAEMRQLLMVLILAVEAENQAGLLYEAAREEFPHRFPELKVACSYYEEIFNDLLGALYENRSLEISFRPPGVKDSGLKSN